MMFSVMMLSVCIEPCRVMRDRSHVDVGNHADRQDRGEILSSQSVSVAGAVVVEKSAGLRAAAQFDAHRGKPPPGRAESVGDGSLTSRVSIVLQVP